MLTDTVYVEVLPDGNMEEVTPGPSTKIKNRLILSNIGDKAEVQIGDKVQIIIKNFDFTSSTLKIEKFDDENRVKIEVVPIEMEIVLKDKCQVQNWYDPYKIPQIFVEDIRDKNDKKLKDQQIVVTPLYNKKCERVGYQIRYGSIERGGCSKEGREVLKKFDECNDYKKIRPKKSSLSDRIIVY